MLFCLCNILFKLLLPHSHVGLNKAGKNTDIIIICFKKIILPASTQRSQNDVCLCFHCIKFRCIIPPYSKSPGSFWDPQSSQTLVLGTPSSPVTKMVPVGGKLWCGSQNRVLIINTTTLVQEVGGEKKMDVCARGYIMTQTDN